MYRQNEGAKENKFSENDFSLRSFFLFVLMATENGEIIMETMFLEKMKF